MHEFYDEKVDIFSFSIIMFALIAETNKIYETGFNVEIRVSRNPLFRPIFAESVLLKPEHMGLVKLMQQSWSHLAKDRPSIDAIIQGLEEALQLCS